MVLERGKEVSEDELKDYVKKNLARYKVPREIVFMEELPRNATGKVLKRELKEYEIEAARPPRRKLRGRSGGHDDLHRDVGARPAHRRDQPRPGLPRRRRAGRGRSTPRSRRCTRGHNQYAPLPGVPALRQAIAAHQRRHYGLELDPDTEVLVTSGATEAIAAALLGAGRARRRGASRSSPSYDSYAADRRAGRRRACGRSRCAPPDWRLDPER